MEYRIKRLLPQMNGRRYHLYDAQGQLILVADHGSPWLPSDPRRHVRFARPDGYPLASLDLPWRPGESAKRQKHVSYAIIFDHAVYAIVNEHAQKERAELPYFTVEVEGMQWLALPLPEPSVLLALYDEIPNGLGVYKDAVAEQMLDPVAWIRAATGDYDFYAKFPSGALDQSALVALALIFLADRFGEPAR